MGVKIEDHIGYKLYCRGMEYYKDGNIEDALNCFLESLKLQPHFKTYEKIYLCLKRMDRVEEANRYIKNAYLMNPNNDKVASEYALLLFESNQYELCNELLNDILVRNSSYGPAVKIKHKLLNRINGKHEIR